MVQRDLLLVLAEIRSVSTLGKETYYWCWLKYGQCREYMGRQLHMLGYLRGIPWVKRNDCWCWLKYGEFWGMSC